MKEEGPESKEDEVSISSMSSMERARAVKLPIGYRRYSPT